MESSFAETDLGVLVDSELTLSQQYYSAKKKAKSLVLCISKNTGSRLRKMILCLCSAPVRHI